MDKEYELLMKEFKKECEEIALDCENEGYPAHGSNYELRVSQLRESDYYAPLFRQSQKGVKAMTVKELMELLIKCDENALVFVGCEGYTNLESGETDIMTNERGDVLIVDSCYYDGEYVERQVKTMKTIKLINRKTKKIVYQKDLDKIASINTTYKNIVIEYHNGLKEMYYKSFINMVIEQKGR